MAELDINSLSPEEQRRILEQMMLNQAQNQLLGTYNPNMQNYEFKKPENFGQALGNMFKNSVVNPLQETFGYREPLSRVVKKYQISGYQADQNERVVEELSRRRLLSAMEQAGVPTSKLQGLDYEALQNVYTNLQSTPMTDPYGGIYTVNALTGERTQVMSPSSEMQQYLFDNPNARPGLTEEQRVITETSPPSFSAYQQSIEDAKAESKAEIDRTTSRLGRIDERALDRIDTIVKPVYSSMSNIGNQRASLEQLVQIMDAGAQTGATAPMLATARNIGLSLGLNVTDPTPEQLFRAISNQIALPLVKSLGQNPTDTDLKIILDSAPSLSQTEEGNRLLIQTIQLKLERDELLARAVMQYEDENAALLAQNPEAYRRGLDRAVINVQNSPEFKGKMALKLRADFARQSNRQTNPESLADKY